MERCDVLVVGAGAVGLAVARELARRGREVIVLEQHGDAGTETSSRNSEVIHAGLYYPTGGLKATLCVAGRDALYAYCEARGIPHQRCGKLLVATDDVQEHKLQTIREQAASNGVPVDFLTPREVLQLEPDVQCTAALHSPLTGIVDSHAFVQSLLGDLEDAGSRVAWRTRFLRARPLTDRIEIDVEGDEESFTVSASWLVNSAGLEAPLVAANITSLRPGDLPHARFAKGSYFSYAGPAPFRRLIYPMPNEAGLGIHATLDLAGRVRFGPDVEWLDAPDYRVDSTRASTFAAAIREYWPAVDEARLIPAYAGVRPKIVDRHAPAADFRIDGPARHGVARLCNLFGIESPGLTAALAIGRHVADTIVR